MYRVLLACSIEYNAGLLESMPVWGRISGFSVVQKVYDGEAALKYLRTEGCDMIIAEIGLPVLDGLQLLKYISREKLCSVTVILSDTVEFEYVRECLLFNAFDYLKKMPDTHTVLALLHRAGEHIAAKRESEKTEGDRYPLTAQEQIMRAFLTRDGDVAQLFLDAAARLDSFEEKRPLENDLLLKKLYSNIVEKVFEEYQWLQEYVSQDDYHRLDYLWAGSADGVRDFFVRKLSHLYAMVNRLYPYTADKSICVLLEYILLHPQADLSLKSTADNVSFSYSYLSSSFFSKLGIHYNEYIVLVKMARAAFLFQNTDMKIYEVCAAVLYQDTNYFTRQFKRFYGVSPSEFKSRAKGAPELDYACL